MLLSTLVFCLTTLFTCVGLLFYSYLFLVASPILFFNDWFFGYNFFSRTWSTIHLGNSTYFAFTGLCLCLLLAVNYSPYFYLTFQKIQCFVMQHVARRNKVHRQIFQFDSSDEQLFSHKYYIYGHFIANEKEPFYIGKGTGKRAHDFKRSTLWQRYLMQGKNTHDDIVVRLHSFYNNEQQALDVEKQLIQQYQPAANKQHNACHHTL